MYRCLFENYYNVVVNILYNGCCNEWELFWFKGFCILFLFLYMFIYLFFIIVF